MGVLKMVKFKVIYKDGNGKTVKQWHDTFASAAGSCAGLDQRCFITGHIFEDGVDVHSGTLYKYTCHGDRKLVNRGFLNAIKAHLERGESC